MFENWLLTSKVDISIKHKSCLVVLTNELQRGIEGKNGMAVVISEISGAATRQGLVSKSFSLRMARKMEEAAALACRRKVIFF